MSDWSNEELAAFKLQKKLPAPEVPKKHKRKKKEKAYILERRYVGLRFSQKTHPEWVTPLMNRWYNPEWHKYKSYERLQDAEKAMAMLLKNDYMLRYEKKNWEYRIVDAGTKFLEKVLEEVKNMTVEEYNELYAKTEEDK